MSLIKSKLKVIWTTPSRKTCSMTQGFSTKLTRKRRRKSLRKLQRRARKKFMRKFRIISKSNLILRKKIFGLMFFPSRTMSRVSSQIARSASNPKRPSIFSSSSPQSKTNKDMKNNRLSQTRELRISSGRKVSYRMVLTVALILLKETIPIDHLV